MSQLTALSASTGAVAEVEIPRIPLAELAPWALFFGLLGALALFFVGADQGAVSLPAGTAIHEWVHDGRHLLGYPCH
jgi:hypothetical protein